MNEAEQIPAITAPAAEPQPARRSRWQRFSPSMGWPAFWSEILIVVLGVVIALAASEAVEDWNWRNKVRDAEVRLLRDTNAIFAWGAEQYMVRPCINAQIDELARRVIVSGEALDPAPVYSDTSALPFALSFVVRAPTRPWRFSVWDALVADGTASHLDPARQGYFSDIRHQAASIQRNEVDRLLGRLDVLALPTLLDPNSRREFLLDLKTLRRLSNSATIISVQLMRAIEAGTQSAPENLDTRVDAYVNASGTVKFCRDHGLPLADWRDFRGTDVNQAAPAPVKAP